MQFVNSRWTVFVLWCLAGVVTAAVKAGLLPPELLVLAGSLGTLPVALGKKS